MYYKSRITFDEFFAISDNVIKISACLASPLSRYPSSVNALYDNIDELAKKKGGNEEKGEIDDEIASMQFNHISNRWIR